MPSECPEESPSINHSLLFRTRETLLLILRRADSDAFAPPPVPVPLPAALEEQPQCDDLGRRGRPGSAGALRGRRTG